MRISPRRTSCWNTARHWDWTGRSCAQSCCRELPPVPRSIGSIGRSFRGAIRPTWAARTFNWPSISPPRRRSQPRYRSSRARHCADGRYSRARSHQPRARGEQAGPPLDPGPPTANPRLVRAEVAIREAEFDIADRTGGRNLAKIEALIGDRKLSRQPLERALDREREALLHGAGTVRLGT